MPAVDVKPPDAVIKLVAVVAPETVKVLFTITEAGNILSLIDDMMQFLFTIET